MFEQYFFGGQRETAFERNVSNLADVDTTFLDAITAVAFLLQKHALDYLRMFTVEILGNGKKLDSQEEITSFKYAVSASQATFDYLESAIDCLRQTVDKCC